MSDTLLALHVILHDYSSSEKHLELPPGLNSFRRLVAYRLAQRFGLTTVTAELPAEVVLFFSILLFVEAY